MTANGIEEPIDEPRIVKWTEQPWNPTTGCDKVSSGWRNCYAETMAMSLQRQRNPRYSNGFNLTLHEDILERPLHWRIPKRIFTCSMSDLYHPKIPRDFILKVFDTMIKASHHTFLVLTKRVDYMLELSPEINWSENIWMGVTVEEDRNKDRIDKLKNSGTKYKFISAEPLLSDLGDMDLKDIDWVFVGGESGSYARPMEEKWVLNVRDQCREQGVMFTFKQWGGKNRKRNGSLLQGKYYHDLPPVMRDY